MIFIILILLGLYLIWSNADIKQAEKTEKARKEFNKALEDLLAALKPDISKLYDGKYIRAYFITDDLDAVQSKGYVITLKNDKYYGYMIDEKTIINFKNGIYHLKDEQIIPLDILLIEFQQNKHKLKING
jgi:hypothetical protein